MCIYVCVCVCFCLKSLVSSCILCGITISRSWTQVLVRKTKDSIKFIGLKKIKVFIRQTDKDSVYHLCTTVWSQRGRFVSVCTIIQTLSQNLRLLQLLVRISWAAMVRWTIIRLEGQSRKVKMSQRGCRHGISLVYTKQSCHLPTHTHTYTHHTHS